jgi:hypothetical protein
MGLLVRWGAWQYHARAPIVVVTRVGENMDKGPGVVPSAEDDRLLQEAFAAAAVPIGNMVTRQLVDEPPPATGKEPS